MLPSHHRAMDDIVNCRTETLGGHVLVCEECGLKTYSYHSCRNRACPKCHAKDTEAWLDKRKQEILPVSYFHITMTLPEEWRQIVRSNQKDLYGILMKAAAAAIIKLAADHKYIGGLVGVMVVLHTWTRTMHYHPHVHCLVTGGGVSKDGQRWLEARDGYLFPKRAVSPIFRAIFIDMVRKLQPDFQIPKAPKNKKWVVHIKDAGHGTEAVLGYLARYVHRVAINNNRIKAVDEHTVTFNYQQKNDRSPKSLTMEAEEFIRRFLQHVPPKGFHKVRYYGLWSTVKQKKAENIRLTMLLADTQPPVSGKDETQSPNHPLEGRKCPNCGQGLLVWVAVINPLRIRAP